jgi:Putative MetA-pathway of phenol degradation
MNITAPLLFAAALLADLPAQAQTVAPAAEPALRDLCADRPGKATPPCILDAGHTQIETGLADAVFLRGHETVTALGASEVRFGLTSNVEAEVAWAPVIVDHQRGASNVTGVGDLTLGFRRALTTPGADGPAVSIQAFVNAPTATHGLGAGGWTGGARLPVSAPLSKTLSLGLTPEVDVVRNASGGGTHLAASTAVSLGRSFGKASLGVEVWGAVDDDPSGRTYQASADLTAALAVGDNVQLDAGANFGLNRNTPDAEVYVGISHRF